MGPRHSLNSVRRWWKNKLKVARPRRQRRLEFEVLEDRVTPTVLVSPFFGAETQTQDGPAKLSSPQVFLIFWGPYWGSTTSPQANQIRNVASYVLGSGYLAGVGQYGSDGKAFLDPVSAYDGGTPPQNFSQSNFSEVVHNQIDNGPLPESDTPAHLPIYVVVTQPGILSATPSAVGYNTKDTDTDVGIGGVDVDDMPEVWVSANPNPNNTTSVNIDQTTLTLSHEIAEIMSDFGQGGFEVNPPPGAPGGNGNQIGDYEGNSYGYRLGSGVDVQPIWSRANQAWLVADGNSQTVNLAAAPNSWTTGQNGPIFNGLYDITINGDQVQGNSNDSILVDASTLAGKPVVQVSLNGELFQFDTNTINSLTINTGSGADVVDVATAPTIPITINGNPGDVVNIGSGVGQTSGTIIVNSAGTVNVGSSQATVTAAVTVNNASTVNVGGSRADQVAGGVTLFNPNVRANLTVDDHLDPGGRFVSVTPGNVSQIQGYAPTPIQFDTGRLNSLSFLGGTGDDTFSLGSFATALDSLPARITVSGGLGVNGLIVNGEASADNAYTITDSSVQAFKRIQRPIGFVEHLTNKITFSTVTGVEVDGNRASGSIFRVQSTAAATPISLVGGFGLDNFIIGDPNHSLDNDLGKISINGFGGGDIVTLDDTGANLPFNASVSFTVTGDPVLSQGEVTRLAAYTVVHGIHIKHVSFNAVIDYLSVGSVNIFGNSVPTGFLVESTAPGTPVAITAGTGINTFQVGDATHSLDGLMSPITLNGNGGSTNLILDDEATMAARDENLDTGSLTRATTDGMQQFTPIYFQGVGHIKLYDDGAGGSGAAVQGVAAGTSVDVYGHSGTRAADDFAVDPHSGTIQGNVAFHGIAADLDIAIYLDYNASGPQTYTLSTDLTGTLQMIARPGAALTTMDGMAEVILAAASAGGNSINILGTAIGEYLNLAPANGDAVVIGSQAPGLGGTLANIRGSVIVGGQTADAVISLTVDDSGDTTPGNRLVTISPKLDDRDYGNHIDGLTALTIYYNLSPASNVTILGGAANELFVAQGVLAPVNLTINGGGGNNVLISGMNAVTLVSGGEDILIAGSTAYDNNNADLMAILTEWSRTDEAFSNRVNNLTAGANGLPALNANTVQWNGGGSQLIGSGGLDWFFANSFNEVFNFTDFDVFTMIQ